MVGRIQICGSGLSLVEHVALDTSCFFSLEFPREYVHVQRGTKTDADQALFPQPWDPCSLPWRHTPANVLLPPLPLL